MIYWFHPLFLSILFTAFNRQILQFRMLVHVLVSIMDHKCVFFVADSVLLSYINYGL